MKEVAVRSADTPFDEVFEDFVRPAVPVVLSGAADDWPCRTKWTPEFLCARYGDTLVDFMDTRDGSRTQRALAEYYALAEDERARWYVTDWDFRKHSPELIADVGWPSQLDVDWLGSIPRARRPDLMWIYIGHAGTRGLGHLDNYGSSAWLAVLQGRKRVRFAVPRAEPGWRVAELRARDLFGDVDALEAGADVAEAVLEEGAVVFVPAGMWHAAHNDTYCLSVTCNFVDGASFVPHRRFETRLWYGMRMLDDQVEKLRTLPAGPERHRLSRHVALALAGLRDELQRELADVERLARS